MLSMRRVLFAVLALGFGALMPGGAGAAIFEDLPDTTEFILNGSDAYHLLGAVRAVTSGDYDQDGDEDVLTVRNGGITAGVSPFVLFWNQTSGGNIVFSVYDDTDSEFGLPYIEGFESEED